MSAADQSTMSSKGQVTIPLRIRKALGLKPGQKLTISFRAGREVVIKPVPGDVSALFGILKANRPVSVEEMSAESGADDDLD